MAGDYVTFIRRVGVPAILRYMVAIGIRPVDLGEESDSAAVFEFLDRVARGDRKVWTVFQEAEAFSPRLARAALRSVLIENRELLAIFDGMKETNRECALWLAATSPALFEHAVSALNTAGFVGGRSWDGFRIVIASKLAMNPDINETTVANFQGRARLALNSSKYAVRDGRLKAMPFQRLVLIASSHSRTTVTQITIYAEGPQESRDTISETNEVLSELVRRVDEGSVIYDPKLKTIEVVVLGGAGVRRSLADAFCGAFLPAGVEIVRLISRDIDFSKFAGEPDLPLLAGDPVEHVAVDEIRFSLPDSGGALVTFERPYSAADRSNIYRDARGWPEVCSPENMSQWEIVAVRLRFLFKGQGKSKPHLRTLELKNPNRTNLREKSDSDHAIMYELLERWGVFEGDRNGADDED